MRLLNSRDRYLAKASRMYHAQLKNDLRENPESRVGSYLSEHGLSPISPAGFSVIKRYQLGLVVKPINKGDERFTGMLAIPYLTKAGVRAIRFRNLNGGKPKFAQHTGQTGRLYNTNAYFDADSVIGIAEGEIDAIMATERLHIPTIGIAGVEMWTAYRKIWSPGFKDFPTVFVFTDGDPVNELTQERPGEELGKAIQESLGFKAKIVSCPEGQDVSSMVARGRANELLEQMKEEPEDDDI